MKFKTQQLPPKVEAVFQTVISLFNQGFTPEELKVSTIAKEAGIGKGTVYEYFGSKEELIAAAIIFEMEKMLEEITQRLESVNEFEQMLLKILEWIDENFNKNTSFIRAFNLSKQMEGMTEKLRAELEKQGHVPGEFEQYLVALTKFGYESGGIEKEIPFVMAASAVTSGIGMYLLYLDGCKGEEPMPRDEARRFVVESIMKTCGNA